MLIRRAEVSDAAAIAGVHVRSWQVAYEGLVPQDFLDRMDPAERQPSWRRQLTEAYWPRKGILVAETDRRIIGFAGLGPTRDEDEDPGSVAEIEAIYLAPETWGTGIGRRLMAVALQILAQADYGEATLWVLDGNARARRFYEAVGWHADGSVNYDTSRGFPLTEVRYRHTLGDKGEADP
jgi:GNAT superfamily N-acetyltransferase